jgi:arylsulfatase A-like enzyme
VLTGFACSGASSTASQQSRPPNILFVLVDDLLTGQYAHTNGIVDNTARDAASHQLNTFAVPLSRAGYETAFIGKWHMGNDDSPSPDSSIGWR